MEVLNLEFQFADRESCAIVGTRAQAFPADPHKLCLMAISLALAVQTVLESRAAEGYNCAASLAFMRKITEAGISQMVITRCEAGHALNGEDGHAR